jgi:hypothetical protein
MSEQYVGLQCPYCKTHHPFLYGTVDVDESSCSLMLKCYACTRYFSAMYSFMYYEDEDGKEIGCGH